MKIKNLIVATGLALTAMSFTEKTVEYKVDAKKSNITWIGRKVTGEHTGNIHLATGTLLTDGKSVTGGSFEIDMNSITNTDMPDKGYQDKLIGHLKSDDFFSTDKFPKATFVIKKITSTAKDQYNLKGDLTIKGITHEVEFPAIIVNADKLVTAKATIKVDRTKYDIKYGSGSFFENLGDKAIDNEFEMNVALVATK